MSWKCRTVREFVSKVWLNSKFWKESEDNSTLPTQFYTSNTKRLESVELHAILLCWKIPSRMARHGNRRPYYGNQRFFKKRATSARIAINWQLGKPIFQILKSRGPGGVWARLAYLAARLKIRKFGVVKITWNLSWSPKTSNFEKIIPEGDASRRIPSRKVPNLSRSLYYGNALFSSKNERRARKKAVRAAAPYF